jgi:hypothetical protein
MSDIFQFYSGSADVPPGKGAGETLVSAPSTYAELRKITHWRRLLATGDMTPLPLTGTAELWEAQPRKPKVRRTDLEDLRLMEGVKPPGNVSEQADTMDKGAKSSKKPKPKAKPVIEDTGSNTRQTFEVDTLAKVEQFTSPDMTTPEENSTIHFCPVCRNYLFAQISDDDDTQVLHRLCKNCGFRQEHVQGGLISEIIVGERSAEGYKILLNEFTPEDPRLPHIHGTIKCPIPNCPSNSKGKESDIIYMKYDAVNLNFLYICYDCRYTWHSTR